MPAYEYTAVKKDGSEMNGSIEGDNERHIRVILRERGLHPISIVRVKNTQNYTKNITFNRKKRLPSSKGAPIVYSEEEKIKTTYE